MGSYVANATVVLTTALWCGVGFSLRAAQPPSQARLIAEVETVQVGVPFSLGVLISLPEGWHTYWLNPGDAGMPPTMEWRLPEGFTAGPMRWPAPRRFDEPPLTAFGYAREVLLFRDITPPGNLATGRTFRIEVNASWLVCDDICVPRTGQLELTLGARAEAPVMSAQWEPVFARARRELPAADPAWAFTASADDKALWLQVVPPPAIRPDVLTRAAFFPAARDLVQYGAGAWTRSGKAYRLRMERISGGGSLPARLEGVLTLPKKDNEAAKALAVDAALAPTNSRKEE